MDNCVFNVITVVFLVTIHLYLCRRPSTGRKLRTQFGHFTTVQHHCPGVHAGQGQCKQTTTKNYEWFEKYRDVVHCDRHRESIEGVGFTCYVPTLIILFWSPNFWQNLGLLGSCINLIPSNLFHFQNKNNVKQAFTYDIKQGPEPTHQLQCYTTSLYWQETSGCSFLLQLQLLNSSTCIKSKKKALIVVLNATQILETKCINAQCISYTYCLKKFCHPLYFRQGNLFSSLTTFSLFE